MPKFLSDDDKDIFNDIESDDKFFGDAACEAREKLIKGFSTHGSQEATQLRARNLWHLGYCAFAKANWPLVKKRLENTVSELNINDDMIMKQPQLQPIGLLKKAAELMVKYEITEAATELRRLREVVDRNLKKILKQVHKQMPAGQAPPLEKIVEEIPGYGKSGQFLPMVALQVPVLREELGFTELIEQGLEALDKRLGELDPTVKQKKLRLAIGAGKSSRGGSLMYTRGVFMQPSVSSSMSAVAEEFEKEGLAEAFVKEAAAADKAVGFVKKTKEDKGCKDGSFSETCKALLKVSDVVSNGFGDTRMVVVKAGKPQQLDTCSTNANIGIVVAAKDGVTLQIGSKPQTIVQLKAGEPTVFDFCLESTLEAANGKVAVLFAQVWHPEFAAVERTSEIRARSSTWSLSEDDVKTATEVVNTHAKKQWEKSAKLWRSESEGLTQLRETMKQEAAAKESAAEDEKKAEKLSEDQDEEEKKKSLEALEKKRELKRQRAAEAEAKKEARKKQLEEERAQRDQWLNFPDVLAAEKKIEELKAERRDANAKLEFDLSTQLTKDISAAERAHSKIIKSAEKAYSKKGAEALAQFSKTLNAGSATSEPEKKEEKKAETPSKASKAESPKKETKAETPKKDSKSKKADVAALKKELERVKAQKVEATKAEDFAAAKKLKDEQKALEEKIKKLEL